MECNIKIFISNIFWFHQKKNIWHEHKKLKDIDPLFKVSIENNIHEQYKDDKINHALYDDEIKNTLEEDIHNIMI